MPAVLVAHTHWDREWYLTVEQLRPRLMRLFENLERIIQNEPEYHSFWLDGQTIAIQDYWDTAGEKPAWLDEALLKRKILIGPWYTLGDEWLSGGESIIRNLFEGRRLMAAYHQDNRIGYLPDSFGHISQMPGILAGFGIDNALMYRGFQEDELPWVEFKWVSPGGGEILGIHLVAGYFNAQRIDVERHLSGQSVQGLLASIQELEKRTLAGALLLMNGVDQALPTHRLSQSIATLGALLPHLQIAQGSIAEYLDLVKRRLAGDERLPTVRGELPHAPQLDGALSARVEQKIANRFIETLLVYYVEPLLALVHPRRRPQYRGMLRRAWKLLVQCHTHDSICSCHSDLVAADVMNRLSKARQLAESLEQELAVEILGVRPAEQPVGLPSTLVLRNPLPWTREDPVEVTLYTPAGTNLEHLVFEQEGKPIPSYILAQAETCRWTEHYFGKVYHKAPGTVRLRALVQPRLAGGSFAGIALRSEPSPQSPAEEEVDRPGRLPEPSGIPIPTRRAGFVLGPNTLDNGVIRLVLHPDGRMDLTHLATGLEAHGLNQILDEVDRGDLYEHARPISGRPGFPVPGTIYLIEDSRLRSALRLDTQIQCNGIICPLQLQVEVSANSPLVSVRAALDNRSQDHWLRVACPVPGTIRELRAHTPFDLVRRELQDGAPYIEGDRVRFARRLGQPMQWGLLAQTDRALLALFNRGLYEYTYEKEGEIQVSLMRFVGLIREDLINYSAEGANRVGVQSVEYAIGLWPQGEIADALRAMHEYSLPPRHFQVFERLQELPAVGLRWSNPYWMLSAWKPAEEGEGTVLRFWNASDTEQTGTVEYAGGLEGAVLARLDETPLRPLPTEITARPKEIVTIVLQQSGT